MNVGQRVAPCEVIFLKHKRLEFGRQRFVNLHAELLGLLTALVNKVKPPVRSAVSSTPAVESTSPGAITGRTALTLVDRPPLNNMMQSATIPPNCAVCMSSK